MVSFTHLFYKKSTQFSLAILAGLCITRLISLCFFAISAQYPQINQQVIDDGFHHYFIGIILVAFSILLRKNRFFSLFCGFGLGVILEEFPVVLDDLGLTGFRFYYLSGWDFAISLIILFISGCLVLRYLSQKTF